MSTLPNNATSATTAKPKLPEINWTANNYEMLHKLLTETEKPENRSVFYGKENKDDNTSGDSKNKVCKRIAEAIVPELFVQNPTAITKRITTKIKNVYSTYKELSMRLRKTGEGLGGQDSQLGGTQLDFYISADGPDDTTPVEAKNLWDQLVAELPVFPRLHRLLGARPNVVPIVVTTPMGPNSQETIWHQRPDCPAVINDENIDPVLREEQARQEQLNVNPPPPPRTTPAFAAVITNTVQTPPPSTLPPATPVTRAPKPSSGIAKAFQKASSTIPQKRNHTAVDQLVDVQRDAVNMMHQNNMMKNANDTRAQLLAEYQAGIWTVAQYKRQLRKLMVVHHPAKIRRVDSISGSSDTDDIPSSDPVVEDE
ncbi:hypothetical protein H1R20_g11452, partial [Candolleomyces eurysporus]